MKIDVLRKPLKLTLLLNYRGGKVAEDENDTGDSKPHDSGDSFFRFQGG